MFLIYGKGKTGEKLKNFLQERNVKFIIRDDNDFSPGDLKGIDLVIVSPGIPFYHRIFKLAKQFYIPVIGEVEFAYRFFHGKILAITGTDGKSTTTYMLGKFLEDRKPFVGGNFGEPFISAVERYNLAVLELSSFQLYSIDTFTPDIAVFLNISVDHLDWHKKYIHYLYSKCKIFKNMTFRQKAVLNYDQKDLDWNKVKAKKYFFSLEELPLSLEGIYLNGTSLVIRTKELNDTVDISQFRLRGSHNIQNLMAATLAAVLHGVSPKTIEEKIPKLQGMPFRLEFIGEKNGVEFYNDAKSTTAHSVETALNSLKDKNVFLIMGGIYKGGDFSFVNRFKNIKKIFLIGKDKERISSFLKEGSYTMKETLEEAVKEAFKLAESNDVVLFSPGCSSFDMFKNYVDRGNTFNKIVKELIQ